MSGCNMPHLPHLPHRNLVLICTRLGLGKDLIVVCNKKGGGENGVVGGKNGVLFAKSTPIFSLKSIKFWGVMGVILIIIYIYIIILYGWGVGYSFSMWQMWQMWQMKDPDPPCPSLKGRELFSPKTHPKIRDFGGPEKGDFSFCRILRHILSHFATDFLPQKPYLCTEFQSALKLQSSN